MQKKQSSKTKVKAKKRKSKTPVVDRILKQLTPERIEKEIAAIQAIKLPPNLQKWVNEYEKVGTRNILTWKIFLKVKQKINWLVVPKIYHNNLQEIKFLVAMFVVLIDDVADQHQNQKLLKELVKIPSLDRYINFQKLSQKERAYLKFTTKIWRRINQLLKKAPRYKEFRDIFKYDIAQTLNAINYDSIINHNHFLMNEAEDWLYAPHTMQFVFTLIPDLMHLSKFQTNDLALSREIVWRAQKMARIGNWINTWEKEIQENDFTSGVFAYAIKLKLFKASKLSNGKKSVIIQQIKRANIEKKLLQEWEDGYKQILAIKKQTKIPRVSVTKLLKGLESLLLIERISRNRR